MSEAQRPRILSGAEFIARHVPPAKRDAEPTLGPRVKRRTRRNRTAKLIAEEQSAAGRAELARTIAEFEYDIHRIASNFQSPAWRTMIAAALFHDHGKLEGGVFDRGNQASMLFRSFAPHMQEFLSTFRELLQPPGDSGKGDGMEARDDQRN